MTSEDYYQFAKQCAVDALLSKYFITREQAEMIISEGGRYRIPLHPPLIPEEVPEYVHLRMTYQEHITFTALKVHMVDRCVEACKAKKMTDSAIKEQIREEINKEINGL
jgi:hypothetical protein